jgi:hypothetical protein
MASPSEPVAAPVVPESEIAPRVLRLEGLEKVPLAGEGNFVWKIPLDAGHAVLKVYYGSRGWPLYLRKSLGNFLTGRTSHMPRTRWRTETECIRLWEANGFRCFRMIPQVTVEGMEREGYMVYEWTPGKHFRDYFKDESIPMEDRLATWRRWLPVWHRRHRLAVETSDPRFIHENGDVKHVMLWKGEFVHFDFEMTFRSRRTRMLVGREIAAYMRSAGRFFGEEMYQEMLRELVAHYPDKALLWSAWEYAWDDSNAAIRVGRLLDRNLRPRHRGRWAKYRVSRDIRDALDGAALNLKKA